MFVCLFVLLVNFSLIWRVTITDEGLQILPYTWHSWKLSSGGSLTCHTYTDTGQPFIMFISEDITHTYIAEHLAVELHVLTTSVCTDQGFNLDLRRIQGERSTTKSPRLSLLSRLTIWKTSNKFWKLTDFYIWKIICITIHVHFLLFLYEFLWWLFIMAN